MVEPLAIRPVDLYFEQMVKPIVQKRVLPRGKPAASRPTTRLTVNASPDTREKILDAAFRQLASEGYGALSVREIARDAGVNHALINYHFRTKDQLVIAVLDAVNQRLLERQRRMYEGPGGLADKWAQACAFYKSDLASGYCRVLMELYAASMSNASLREQFKPRMQAWHNTVVAAVRSAVEVHRLDLPVSAEVIGLWICNFWTGMEIAMLTGLPKPPVPHEEALFALESILRRLERTRSVSLKKEPEPHARSGASARRRNHHAKARSRSS